MVATELLILVVSVFILYFLSTRRPKNYPPGPTGWPIFGNLFQINRDIPTHKNFSELGKKYGDILGLYFTNRPVVILNNYKHIKQALSENVFAGRQSSHMLLERNLGGNRGLLFSEGKPWQEQRRFTLKTLRDLGFGKKSMEALIIEEVNELITGFKKDIGQPISTQNRFNLAVLNGLWALLTGEKFSHDDPRLHHLLKSLNNVVTGRRPVSAILADVFPSVHKLRNAFPNYLKNPSKQFFTETYKLIGEIIDEHKDSLQEDSPRDFMDTYLNECKKTTDVTSSFYKEDGYLGLHVVILDLFVAGAETTSTTLTWAFLILALHPEKQNKLFEEINRVVGMSRSVSLTDRPDLPYLEATIMEVLRYSAIVAIGVFHKAHEDVQFNGYTIPKGATIFPNIYSACHDVSAWGDPENFRPERFLTPDGKCLVRNDAFIPFSVGKRVCLGETLAKDELLLFMGNLFQQFEVKTFDGEATPTVESLPSFVLSPKPHKLVLLDRNAA